MHSDPDGVGMMRRVRFYRLVQEEGKHHQDDKEAAGQHGNAAEVAPDVSVVGIELGDARSLLLGHEGRGLADLSSILLGHEKLLLYFATDDCVAYGSISFAAGQIPRYAACRRGMDSTR